MIKELLSRRMKEYKIGTQKYKVNQLIFETFITILCLIFIFSYLYYGNDSSNHLYMKCNEIKCENPYYHSIDCGSKLPANETICTQQVFDKGQIYGNPPPPIVVYFNLIWPIGLIICLLLNHFIYNKGFRYKTFNDEIINEVNDNHKAEEVNITPPVDAETSANDKNLIGGDNMEAYCMKEKKTMTMKNTTEVTMKNGNKAIKGECSSCGTKMFKIKGK